MPYKDSDKQKWYTKIYVKEKKEKRVKYLEDNKEKMKEYQRQYFQNNKERIRERLHAFKRCDCCNHSYAKSYWSRHIKSKKHIHNECVKRMFDENEMRFQK